MKETSFNIIYKGKKADKGYMPLREYSESIAGLERILHYGITLSERLRPLARKKPALFEASVEKELALSERFKMPTGREKNKEYAVHIFTPQRGSFFQNLDIISMIADAGIRQYISYLWAWVGLAVKKQSQVKYESELKIILDFFSDRVREQPETSTQIIQSVEKIALKIIENRLPKDVQAFTCPVRKEQADFIEAYGSGTDKLIINKDMADKIAIVTKLGKAERFRSKIVGVLIPEKKVKIKHPDAKKFVQAQVLDPAFQSPNNIYIQALAAERELDMDVKIRRQIQDQKLIEIFILNAKFTGSTRV